MQNITFKIIDKEYITTEIAESIIPLLKQQGKVHIPNSEQIKLCFRISLCYVENRIVGIGALKPKTTFDFDEKHSDLPNIETQFNWELGYFYVSEEFRSYGISTTMARLLLKEVVNENIMASTELYSENAMVFVLEKFGFIRCGRPWKSIMHDGTIGLFLKFKKGTNNDKN